MEKKTKKEPKRINPTQPDVCCPYFDAEKKCCVQSDCYRMLGFECKYSNRRKENK